MEHLERTLDDLITDYCTGNISNKDLITLHSWMEKSEFNRKQVNDQLKLYRDYRAYESYDMISMDNAWDKIITRVSEIKRRRKIIFYRIAASIAILLIGSYYIIDSNLKGTDEFVSEIIAPGAPKATLILADGSEINLEEIGDSTIQLAEGANIQKNKEVISYQDSKVEKEIFNTIKIPRGGEYTLVLSDGTKVWLNSDSELSYPVKFIGDTRTVSLKGEAYLEVAENKSKPFVVKTPGTEIEVLGTAFNVKAYPDELGEETTLVRGCILCYKPGHKENAVQLMPGSQAITSDESSQVAVKSVDADLYTSWKDGLFVFRKLPLEEIMKTLGRWYNTKTRFEDPSLKDLHFTGDLERYETINTHLDMIKLTTNVDFEISNNEIYVRKK